MCGILQYFVLLGNGSFILRCLHFRIYVCNFQLRSSFINVFLNLYEQVVTRHGGFSLSLFQVGLVSLLVVDRKILYLFFINGVFFNTYNVFFIPTYNVCLELHHLSTLMPKQHGSIRWINIFFTYGCGSKHANSVHLELCWIHQENSH